MIHFSDKMKTSVGKLGRIGVFFVMAFFAVAFPACEKDKPVETPTVDTELYQYIQGLYYYFYYWNRESNTYIQNRIPLTLTPEEYFEYLKYNRSRASTADRNSGRYDRWGAMLPFKEFTGLMDEGKETGFGYIPDLTYTEETGYSVRICMVYPGSPMANAGVERGYELLTVNGKKAIQPFYTNDNALYADLEKLNTELAKESNTYLFADREGNPIGGGTEKTISAGTFTISAILRNEVYEFDGNKVGYLIYNSFLTVSEESIVAALTDFSSAGVTDLVLDLRYNGGGDVDVADRMAECLLPFAAGSDSVVFAKQVYSDLTKQRISGWKDEVRKIKRHVSALNLNRLFFITSHNTASASEELINCLEPFFPGEIFTIGTSTNGKPVGMMGFVYPPTDELKAGETPEWILFPITFRLDNSAGKGGYYNGISPDHAVDDDLYHDFGVDSETLKGEECLQAVIEYIQTGGFPAAVSAKSVKKELPKLIELKGLQVHAGCI